jgi:hypothetical protein
VLTDSSLCFYSTLSQKEYGEIDVHKFVENKEKGKASGRPS